MPAKAKRRGTPIRPRKAEKVRRLALAIEGPLNEAIDAAQSLRLMGQGLVLHGDEPEGRAVTAAARIACERLAEVRHAWCRLHEAARGKPMRPSNRPEGI